MAEPFTNVPTAVTAFLAEYKYKIELHAHSSPASGCSELPPPVLVSMLKSQNYDMFVLTNHFTPDNGFQSAPDPVAAYLDDYRRCAEEGEKQGIRVLLGAEYRFRECSNDYLVYGIDEAFLRETVNRLDMTFCEFYEAYHREDILILQAHPFRNGISVMPSDHMDGMETFNLHPNHNSRVATANKYARAEGIPILTMGTDLHHHGHEGVCSTRVKTVPQNEKELVRLLRSRDYLMEIGGCPVLPYASFPTV